MLRALFKQGSFWTITNEKTFRGLGSGFVMFIIQGKHQSIKMNTYLLFKSIHLIAVISWMAGLLYLPRIFVKSRVLGYLLDGSGSSEQGLLDKQFVVK